MVSEEKVKIMSKIARYEKNEGVHDLEMNRYERKDYIKIESYAMGVAITVAYCIVVLILLVGNIDFVINLLTEGKGIGIVIATLIGYIAILFVYESYIQKKAGSEYDEAAKRIQIYDKLLGELEALYEEEENMDDRPTIGTEEKTDGTIIDI